MEVSFSYADWRLVPRILNPDTKWRCAVIFILRPFYLPEEPPVPTGYEAGRTQNRSGHSGGKKNYRESNPNRPSQNQSTD